MSAAPPRFLHFGGDGDYLTGHGAHDAAATLLLVSPPFEEANRCRAIMAAVQRGLTAERRASWLLDLPGTGDSVRAIETVRLACWRDAVAAAARACGASHVAAWRGAALVDDAAGLPRWRLAPLAGAALLRDLERPVPGAPRASGWALPAALSEALRAAEPAGAARVVRLAGDPRPADAVIAAAPPWRRAEPARDDALAAAIVADLGAWIEP